MDIQNLAVMVTGAASGMGAETARYLASLGAKVAVCDVNGARAIELATQIGGFGVEINVTNEKSIIKGLKAIEENIGVPRVCVNCAGILFAGRIVGREGPMAIADFEKVISVNLTGTFNVMRLVADKMSKCKPLNDDNEQGVIINTASIAAFEGQIGQIAYSASKSGVVGMTLPAARELAKFGIRVVAIAPGLIETPMLHGLQSDAQQSLINSTIFPKRLGKASEYAKLVEHIIENPLLNGDVIRLDGAIRLSSK